MEGERDGRGKGGEGRGKGREGGLCSSNISFKKALTQPISISASFTKVK